MTIEEKAKEHVLEEVIPNLGFDIHLEPIVASYVVYKADTSFRAGAEWLLEKAFYWLKDNANDYAITAETDSGLRYATISCDLFDDFKKAMEE